jgi:hypothetical protein
MQYPIDVKEIPIKLDYHKEVINAKKEAEVYLNSFTWCKRINKSAIYTNLGRVLCVFLFDIDNTSCKEDNLLWVIVGDIPPMYLDTFGPKTTVQVLEDYIRLSEHWIHQVKIGGPINECYPFNVKPTLELAELLEIRVSFMKNTLIKNIDDLAIENIG